MNCVLNYKPIFLNNLFQIDEKNIHYKKITTTYYVLCFIDYGLFYHFEIFVTKKSFKKNINKKDYRNKKYYLISRKNIKNIIFYFLQGKHYEITKSEY